jgi:hypothetical protein
MFMTWPSPFQAVRKKVIKETLFGCQWWSTLYPDEETMMLCFMANLELDDKEDIKAFKGMWRDELCRHVMKLIRNDRQKLTAKFISYLLKEVKCPPLPTKPKPSVEAINAWKAKLAPHFKSKCADSTWIAARVESAAR